MLGKKPVPFTMLNFIFKKKKLKNGLGGGDILPQNSLNLQLTYKKLHFKGKPNRFSGYRDPSIETKISLFYI